MKSYNTEGRGAVLGGRGRGSVCDPVSKDEWHSHELGSGGGEAGPSGIWRKLPAMAAGTGSDLMEQRTGASHRPREREEEGRMRERGEGERRRKRRGGGEWKREGKPEKWQNKVRGER